MVSESIPTVAYFRMSTGKQEESIPDQRRWASAEAPRHGLNVLAEFEDAAVSGDEIIARTGLQALLAYCDRQHAAKAPVAAVLVWNLDRFSRADAFETGALYARLMRAGVRFVYSMKGVTDLTDATARVMLQLEQELGRRAYSAAISGNMMRRMLNDAKEGKWHGRALYGYRVGPDGRLVVVPEEAEHVRWAFEQYASRHVGAAVIARELATRGAPKPRGSKGWTTAVVSAMLRNEHYTGVRVAFQKSMGKYHRVVGDKLEAYTPERTKAGKPRPVRTGGQFRVEGAHEAIVPRELWAAVRAKQKELRASGKVCTVRRAYPLTGLLYCPDCGGRLQGRLSRGRTRADGTTLTYRRYICTTFARSGKAACNSNMVDEAVILRAIGEACRKWVESPNQLEALRSKLGGRLARKDKDGRKEVGQLARELADMESKIDRAAGRLLDVSKDLLADAEARLRKLKAARAAVQDRLDAARRAAAERGRMEATVDKALRKLATLPADLKSVPFDQLGEVLRGLVARVDLRFVHVRKEALTRSKLVGGTVYFLCPDMGDVRFRSAKVLEPAENRHAESPGEFGASPASASCSKALRTCVPG